MPQGGAWRRDTLSISKVSKCPFHGESQCLYLSRWRFYVQACTHMETSVAAVDERRFYVRKLRPLTARRNVLDLTVSRIEFLLQTFRSHFTAICCNVQYLYEFFPSRGLAARFHCDLAGNRRFTPESLVASRLLSVIKFDVL